MTVIKGRLGAVYLASLGAGATAFTGEATTANGAKTVFTISDEDKRFVDPATPIVVNYSGSPVTDYASVQYPGGVVTWAVSPGAAAVTLEGAYLPVTAVAQAKGWTLDAQWDFADSTVFGDTMRVNTPIFIGSTVSIDQFYLDETYFTEMTTAARVTCGFDLFVNVTGGSEIRYTGSGTIATRSLTLAVDGLAEEPLTINVNDGPYYMAGLA